MTSQRSANIDVFKITERNLARRRCTTYYAWAVPDPDTVAYLATFSPIIELGAGTGLWASLLAQAGADIVAFDRNPGGNDWIESTELFFPVTAGGDEQLAIHPKRTLFLCWPTMCWDVTATLAAYKGDTLLYIGEHDACTGWSNDLDDESKWQRIVCRDIPQWDGINDWLMVFKRVLPPNEIAP